ncbi:hypothetical protein OSB04_029178 [Centaurea solstitialis]|uniref:Integrase catalytic domain-containing protein n=1 Tax=Centaurea solstitialis TaxID=347529 RepID=A0AA38W1B7_9ASTR|nr:hypothetical protein OSB04_029178 [Centaurea solstitialis]
MHSVESFIDVSINVVKQSSNEGIQDFVSGCVEHGVEEGICNEYVRNDQGVNSVDLDEDHQEDLNSPDMVESSDGSKSWIPRLMIIERNRYEVYKFVDWQNHILYSDKEMRFSKSNRQLNYSEQKNICYSCTKKIGVTKGHRLRETLSGGVRRSGADEKARLNYKEFGDCVSFDATYRTISNHKKTVVIGAALMNTENEINYTWVLRAFMKAHGRQMVFVMTDQCPAMKQAIPIVFPESKHRLCLWHITDKLDSKITSYMRQSTTFVSDIKKLVWNVNFGTEIRSSWIPAFFKDFPMSGLIQTPSRSESVNAFFNVYHEFWSDLRSFLTSFDNAIEEQRTKHASEEVKTKTAIPKKVSPSMMEEHATTVYTLRILFDFQEELSMATWNCGLDERAEVSGLLENAKYGYCCSIKVIVAEGYSILTSGIRAINSESEIKTMDSQEGVFANKVPMLKPNEFDMWKIRIRQHILLTDYSMWDVIENGPTERKAGEDGVVPPPRFQVWRREVGESWIQRQRTRSSTTAAINFHAPDGSHVFTSFANDPTLNAPKREEYRDIVNRLLPRQVLMPKRVDWNLLRSMGVENDIKAFLEKHAYDEDGNEYYICHAWERVFDIAETLYRELIVEFVATFRFDAIKALEEFHQSCMTFRLGGVWRSLSLVNFALALGIYTQSDVDAPQIYVKGFLASSDRLLHRMLIQAVNARSSSEEKVTVHDLWLLEQLYTDDKYPNAPYLIAVQLTKASGYRDGSRLVGGQYITRLAKHFGILIDAAISSMTNLGEMGLIDMDQLQGMGVARIEHMIGRDYNAWIHNPQAYGTRSQPSSQPRSTHETGGTSGTNAGQQPAEWTAYSGYQDLSNQLSEMSISYGRHHQHVEYNTVEAFHQANWQSGVMNQMASHFGIQPNTAYAPSPYWPYSEDAPPGFGGRGTEKYEKRRENVKNVQHQYSIHLASAKFQIWRRQPPPSIQNMQGRQYDTRYEAETRVKVRVVPIRCGVRSLIIRLCIVDVYYVEQLKYNLVTVSQVCDKKHSILFNDEECLILSLEFKIVDRSMILLRAPRKENVYCLDLEDVSCKSSLICLLSKASLSESSLWHRRMCHMNFKNMTKLVKGNLVRGLPAKEFSCDDHCVSCLKGKQHKSTHKPKEVNTISFPLQLLHMDLFGPTNLMSIGKKSYCLVIVDDYSRFTWVFFLRTKDETKWTDQTLCDQSRKQDQSECKSHQVINGTEFKNRDLNYFCEEKGIERQYSVPRTPQQNGVAERRNRTLIEAARTMFVDSKLPITFWAEAVNTACYVQNRVLIVQSKGKTPYEIFEKKKPFIGFLKPFGCPCTILNTKSHLGKFDSKSEDRFLVGYSSQSKALRVFNSSSRIIEESDNVECNENTPNIPGVGPNWLFDIDSLSNSLNMSYAVDTRTGADKSNVKQTETPFVMFPMPTVDPIELCTTVREPETQKEGDQDETQKEGEADQIQKEIELVGDHDQGTSTSQQQNPVNDSQTSDAADSHMNVVDSNVEDLPVQQESHDSYESNLGFDLSEEPLHLTRT